MSLPLSPHHRAVAGLAAMLLVASVLVIGTQVPEAGAVSYDYSQSCIDDDPNGYTVDDRDFRTIPVAGTLTIEMNDCTWFYASGAITPLGSGEYLGGATQVFEVTGAASLNIYIAGAYGFVWTFEAAATTTTSTTTTTVAPTTTTTPAPTTTAAAPTSVPSPTTAAPTKPRPSPAPGGSVGSPTTGASSVRAGDSIEVTGNGFQPNSEVEVWMESTPVLLGRVKADGAGAFEASFTVPASAEAGSHRIVLRGLDASGTPAEVELPLTIIGSATTAPTPPAGTDDAPSQLAATGLPTGIMVGTALALLVAGGFLLVLRRRQPTN